MGSIVFPAARALVAWLEKHGGNLKGLRALGMIFNDVMVLDMFFFFMCLIIFFVLMILQNLIGSACSIESLLHVPNIPGVT